jgi:hypothetical protein
VTDVPNFVKGYSTSLVICLLSSPIALWIHQRCKRREREMAAEAAITGVPDGVDAGSENTSDPHLPETKRATVDVSPETK